ncbi:hypothetical protein PRIPAC_83175 [Pristionchus pacificus]|uniref:Uncharacterized protein n=1 Tax=Pristionchus pacificus TaxID=54126 RepID=A0A2A6C9T2_PRIPA|nr:hypothetical protein PRIPAC_83175 [Pristionchus pacificus]|eukprot:PDM74840.1 hypothetical protein PRIPAC_43330 [Pristionchus pacificus]
MSRESVHEIAMTYSSEVSATALDLLNGVNSIPCWLRARLQETDYQLNWQTKRIKKILAVNDVTMTPTCQILNALVWVSFLMCASNLGVLIGTFIFPGIFPYLFGRHGTMILAIVVLPIFMRMKLKAEKFEYNVETRRSLLLYSLNMGIMLGSLFPLDYFHHVLTLPLLPLCLAFSYQILSAGLDRRLSVSLGCFGLSSILFGVAFFSFNSLSLLNIYSHLTTLAVTTLMLMFILGEIRTPEQTSAGYEMFVIMLVAIVRMMADSLGRPYRYKYYY